MNFFILNLLKYGLSANSSKSIPKCLFRLIILLYCSCNNSYYNSIDNCKKCETKNTCSLCNDGFTFINGNKTKCIEKNTLENKYYQDPNDNSNYESCSKIDSNCVTCSSYNTCLTCSENFGIYKSLNKCVNISAQENYKNNTDNLYYPCNEIEGCLNCLNESICINCNEEIFILMDNKCTKISDLGNKYYKDLNISKYRLCNEGVSNCEECNSETECIKC